MMLILRPTQVIGVLFTWLVASAACAQSSPEKAARPTPALPADVRAAMDARRAHRTFHSKLSVTYHAVAHREGEVFLPDPSNPLDIQYESRQVGLGRRETPVTEHLIIERVADTLRQTAWGDDAGFRMIDYEEDQQWRQLASEAGVRKWDENAQRLNEQHHQQPRFALIYDGLAWSHVADAVIALASTPEGAALSGFPTGVLDVPALGAAPFVRCSAFSFGTPSETLPWQYAPSERTERDNTRMEKHAYDPIWHHAYRMEWVLDDSRGGQPVRATLYKDDRMVYSAVTSLQKVGERWFPQTVDFYRDGFAGGLDPYMTIRVDQASFDEPWHRQEPFTPEDIGFVFGTQLATLPRERLPVFGKLGVTGIMWDGMQLISGEDYWSMIHFDGMSEHPMIVKAFLEETGWSSKQYLEWQRKQALVFRRRWEKAYGPIDIPGCKKSDAEDDWDVFVREFVAQHGLSGKRKESAYRLLKHSKALRDFHQHKYKKAIEKAKAVGDSKKAKKLEEPVARIFKYLKRGLWRLIPPSERKRG